MGGWVGGPHVHAEGRGRVRGAQGGLLLLVTRAGRRRGRRRRVCGRLRGRLRLCGLRRGWLWLRRRGLRRRRGGAGAGAGAVCASTAGATR